VCVIDPRDFRPARRRRADFPGESFPGSHVSKCPASDNLIGGSPTEIVPTRYSTGTARHTAIHAGTAQPRNLPRLHEASGFQYHSGAAKDVPPLSPWAVMATSSKNNQPQSTIGEARDS